MSWVKRKARTEHANELINLIAAHGRRFFYCKSTGKTAHFSLIKNRVYFNDDYTGKAIMIRQTKDWKGFSHGGTLRALIEKIAEYIRTGNQIYIGWIGPETSFTNGNIWGYTEEEMTKTRTEALKLSIIKQPESTCET